MTAENDEWSELPILTTTVTRNCSEKSVNGRSRVPTHAWVKPTTNWSQPKTHGWLKGCHTVTIRVRRTHQFLTMVIQITHKQSRSTHTSKVCKAAIDVSNRHTSSHLGQYCGYDENIEVLPGTTTLKTSFSNSHTQILVGEMLYVHLSRMQQSLEP